MTGADHRAALRGKKPNACRTGLLDAMRLGAVHPAHLETEPLAGIGSRRFRIHRLASAPTGHTGA